MRVVIPRGRIISKNMRNSADDWKLPLRTCVPCAVSFGHKPPPSQGQRFPDGTLPPEIPMMNRRWVPDAEQIKCLGCDRLFTLARRRHHCRACGLIFCADCSSDKCLIPKQLIITPTAADTAKQDLAQGHRLRTCHRCARALENVQEDLRAMDPKAELSYQRRAFQTTAPPKAKKKKPPPKASASDDDDDVDNKKSSSARAASSSAAAKRSGRSSSSGVAGTVGTGAVKKAPTASRGVSSSASVGGGSVMSGSASLGGIHASRKVSFDEGSIFSGSASVHTAQTAPPAFHRHSPFQVIEPFRVDAPRVRSYTRDVADDGDNGNGGTASSNGNGSPPSRVDLLRRRYQDTTRSLAKSASAVTKTAASARDKMADRLSSLREGLGKGLSFRSSSQ